jgi:hypothetical protein
MHSKAPVTGRDGQSYLSRPIVGSDDSCDFVSYFLAVVLSLILCSDGDWL